MAIQTKQLESEKNRLKIDHLFKILELDMKNYSNAELLEAMDYLTEKMKLLAGNVIASQKRLEIIKNNTKPDI